jgi:D-alanine-D-alanine ligase
MNKIASKRIFESVGIPTPRFEIINADNDLVSEAEKILGSIGLPLVTKPVNEGSSLGVTIVRKAKDLVDTIRGLVTEFGGGFAERFIDGMNCTVGILGWGAGTRALPILELVPKREFYDYEAKYQKGMTEFIIPARLPPSVYKRTQEVALRAHHSLGCHGFSRVDIMVDQNGTPWVHDVNTIPGLTDLSDLPAEAEACGISYDEMILEILESALHREDAP